MNVYDFDHTIYDGNCTFDFIVYCGRQHPRTLAALIGAAGAGLRMAMGRADKTFAKQRLFGFMRQLDDVDREIERFWDGHIDKIKRWYRIQMKPDDLVISASPAFLVAPACRRLGLRPPLASPVDAATGRYFGVNCDGEEKVRRFREAFPDARVERFYSDSDDDLPMARLAERSFKVRGDEIAPWRPD
ncbi:MAG: haloacid dehalogenase-like hydrolase [Clostridiales bacterium]|nr:haloacid dehalogenase-like hydrolase [Clostridiales bacterium]